MASWLVTALCVDSLQGQWTQGTGVVTLTNSTDSVGIGASAPIDRLQIGSQFVYHDGGDKFFGFNVHYSGGGKYMVDGPAGLIRWDTDYGAFRFETAPSGTASGSVTTTPRLTIVNAGNVGLGTINPSEILHLKSNGPARIMIEADADNANESDNPQVLFKQDGGLVAATVGFATGSNSFAISNDWDHSDGDINLMTGGLTRFTVTGDGSVGVGTTSPTDELEVNGTIRAKEVIVESSPWPDYVFSPDHPKPSLEAWQDHIAEHGHLPDVPSADDVAESGVSLGQMQHVLLRKIEELTLLLIEEREARSAENARLQAEVDRLRETLGSVGAPAPLGR